jgi:hypothetical protein
MEINNVRFFKIYNDVDDKVFIWHTRSGYSLIKILYYLLKKKKTPTGRKDYNLLIDHFNKLGQEHFFIKKIKTLNFNSSKDLFNKLYYYQLKYNSISEGLNIDRPTRDITQYRREYNLTKKDYFKQLSLERVYCEVCDCKIRKIHKNQHYSTKKHCSNVITYKQQKKAEEENK